MPNKIAIVVGTRPEIIKMSPVIRELAQRSLDYFIIHSGQHYSYNMDALFFKELGLPKPRYNLHIPSPASYLQGQHTGSVLMEIEKTILKEQPTVILVQGDTITTLLGALCAAKLDIEVGHVEAGLRSYDRSMPEEINRVLSDHVSTYLFAPTEGAKANILKEGISSGKIFVTGNTIVDVVYQHLGTANANHAILSRWGLQKGGYFLVTTHRQGNVDIEDKLEGILEGLRLIHREFHVPIICPLHPRTKKQAQKFKIAVPREITIIEPVGFYEFLCLETHARLILTDSGGLQEEACILHVPCVTFRESTERPETLEIESNILAGTDPDKIVKCARLMLSGENNWPNPFGDGESAQRIVEIILSDEAPLQDCHPETHRQSHLRDGK